MHWRKLGLLYCLEPIHPKLYSHAANPLPLLIEGDLFRVFYSGRDMHSRSSVGFVDVDLAKREVVSSCKIPVFEHGPEGSFYSHGVSLGNSYEAGGQRYVLFMGWQCPPDAHWRGEIGQLVIDPDLSLRLDGDKPLMPVNDIDQLSLSYPWVIREEQGGFRMWYGSTVTWDAGNGEMLHVINHAVSEDGHHWRREGLAVPYGIGVAQAFSRPSVIAGRDGAHHMWFSYRRGTGTKYRIGYAHSRSREAWDLRLQEAGIDVSPSGWDSEMIEYPFVFDHKGERYMLYNGNGYGKTGFGLAVLESE
ncbi:MAG: hypothetical protein HYX75_25145 [Acidobacteria bacterium]|nr:hypothetical protein [Acidobacteriota bacterium]